jgi:hypothetical protein
VVRRIVAVLALSVALGAPAVMVAPRTARADATETSGDGDPTAARRRAARAAAEADDDARAAPSIGSLFSRRSGLFGTAIMAIAFYFVFMRGRGGGGSGNWGSYYLFWIVAPVIVAAVSSHPAILLVVVVGLVARRWLPDPFLWLSIGGRIRALEADVAANPGNVTARRDLASLWLERRRPARALPLVEQALARDAASTELLFLRGCAELQLREPARAVDSLVGVVHRDPGFRYGDGYLRAADALMALGRWDDAEDALDHYLKIMSSSIEAHYKRLRIRKARKDEPGARQARQELRDVWRTLPAYQRRKQLGWYLRALVVV